MKRRRSTGKVGEAARNISPLDGLPHLVKGRSKTAVFCGSLEGGGCGGVSECCDDRGFTTWAGRAGGWPQTAVCSE